MDKEIRYNQTRNAILAAKKALENKDHTGFRRKQLINNLEDAMVYLKDLKPAKESE